MAAHADGRDQEPARRHRGRVERRPVIPGQTLVDFRPESVKIDIQIIAEADQLGCCGGDADIAKKRFRTS
jgi:hypothetical protein